MADETVKKPSKLIEQSIKLPGALAAVALLAILYPLLGIFPKEITIVMLMAFSIPTLYSFLLSVAFNRDIGVGMHIIVVVILAYVLYIMSSWPFDIHGLFAHSFFFMFGAFISMISYGIYYFLFRVGRKYGQMSYRLRFFVSFLPCVVTMIFIGMVLSLMFSYWLIAFEAVICL